jgi:hypothetical protein
MKERVGFMDSHGAYKNKVGYEEAWDVKYS